MEIRKYTAAEFNACLELFHSNEDLYFDKSELSGYAQFLEKDALDGRYFVAKQNSLTIAAGGYLILKGTYWFTWGVVLRSRQGQGVGTDLLRFRLQHIERDANPQAPGAVVRPDVKLSTSQHTEGFYTKHGFRKIRWVENGYGPNLHKIEMQWLPQP